MNTSQCTAAKLSLLSRTRDRPCWGKHFSASSSTETSPKYRSGEVLERSRAPKDELSGC